jgi:hypothetical protein
MSELMRCGTCAGSIVYDIKSAAAACMFCGSSSLSAAPTEEPLPTPDAMIPSQVDGTTADGQFREWAQSSWWYPKELRSLRIQTKAMLLPAWRFYSHLETHWTGLESAGTRSGKRPVSGLAHVDTHTMVPASGGVSQKELHELVPYDEGAAVGWTPEAAAVPWEPPQLTEQAARLKGHSIMASWHAGQIQSAEGLLTCNVSPVIDDQDIKLFMLPIYIGAFRFRQKPWRFLINAQTGEVVGDAPIDRVKVALVILGTLALILLIYVLVVMFA